MISDVVQDTEVLYRRIPADRDLYTLREDGSIEVHSSAFSDREFRISVDRAKLCGYNPRYTLRGEKGGVVSLLARDVCNTEGLTRNDQQGRAIQHFAIEIDPAPLENNSAHAEIYAIPPFTRADRKSAFRRLCQRLAYLAEARAWEIWPEDLDLDEPE
jgi:hypothetical protein